MAPPYGVLTRAYEDEASHRLTIVFEILHPRCAEREEILRSARDEARLARLDGHPIPPVVLSLRRKARASWAAQ